MELNYAGEVKGFGRFPDGKVVGTKIQVGGSFGIYSIEERTILTTNDGETIIFKGSGKAKTESGQGKGVGIYSVVTASQEYKRINNVVGFWEGEFDPKENKAKVTFYEWK